MPPALPPFSVWLDPPVCSPVVSMACEVESSNSRSWSARKGLKSFGDEGRCLSKLWEIGEVGMESLLRYGNDAKIALVLPSLLGCKERLSSSISTAENSFRGLMVV